MSKRPRTLDGFFIPPPSKKSRVGTEVDPAGGISSTTHELSHHSTYPFPIPHLPSKIRDRLDFVPAVEGRIINHQPDLDLLYFQPFVPKDIQRDLFEFLRSELFFYRVKYTIKRGSVETEVNTPRYTTVFGIDETAKFAAGEVIDATSGRTLAPAAYKCKPRPIPECLETLKTLTENVTGCQFNFALVNYYSTGNDSISYHSDDERFLGINPQIASFTLGAGRDFLLKHKPTLAKHESEIKPMKFALASGDMLLMGGKTQSHWLHSIPKRKGGDADKGRINITFRRAMVKEGTENYYRYNVGEGSAYGWDASGREMVPWQKQ
jgi:hypothetical protein